MGGLIEVIVREGRRVVKEGLSAGTCGWGRMTGYGGEGVELREVVVLQCSDLHQMLLCIKMVLKLALLIGIELFSPSLE